LFEIIFYELHILLTTRSRKGLRPRGWGSFGDSRENRGTPGKCLHIWRRRSEKRTLPEFCWQYFVRGLLQSFGRGNSRENRVSEYFGRMRRFQNIFLRMAIASDFTKYFGDIPLLAYAVAIPRNFRTRSTRIAL